MREKDMDVFCAELIPPHVSVLSQPPGPKAITSEPYMPQGTFTMGNTLQWKIAISPKRSEKVWAEPF